jgi:hypothetical protein
LLHNQAMTRKLLVCRLGAGSMTIALCAALPGCNLAILPDTDCVGRPSSRGSSSVECPDAEADRNDAPDSAHDATADLASDALDSAGGDAAKDQGSGEGP